MRRLLSVVLLFFASAAFGQQVKSRVPEFEEFRMLLEQSGYEAFSFDLSAFLADRYDMAVRIKEYVDGRPTQREQMIRLGSNKLMVSDFPADQQADLLSGKMADPATRTYRQAERLTVGFYPSGADTLAAVVFNVPGMTTARSWLGLRGVANPQSGQRFYRYLTRPFRLDEVSGPEVFIPLVFFGSMWYDAKSNFFRFCGEKEIAPDLSTEMVGSVPHFFVIGLELKRRQDN